MKWLLLLLTLSIGCKFLFGQRVAIEIDKNNFFYCGVDNPVTILVENIKSSSIKLETDNGVIVKSKNNYTYVPKYKGVGRIIIKKKIGKSYVEIGRREYRIFLVPDPVAILGPSRHSGRSFIKAGDYMRAELQNFDFDVRFRVDSFSVFIKRQDSSRSIEVFNRTNRLTEEAMKLIQGAELGDTIIFDRICAIGPDRITRYLLPITIPFQE